MAGPRGADAPWPEPRGPPVTLSPVVPGGTEEEAFRGAFFGGAGAAAAPRGGPPSFGTPSFDDDASRRPSGDAPAFGAPLPNWTGDDVLAGQHHGLAPAAEAGGRGLGGASAAGLQPPRALDPLPSHDAATDSNGRPRGHQEFSSLQGFSSLQASLQASLQDCAAKACAAASTSPSAGPALGVDTAASYGPPLADLGGAGPGQPGAPAAPPAGEWADAYRPPFSTDMRSMRGYLDGGRLGTAQDRAAAEGFAAAAEWPPRPPSPATALPPQVLPVGLDRAAGDGFGVRPAMPEEGHERFHEATPWSTAPAPLPRDALGRPIPRDEVSSTTAGIVGASPILGGEDMLRLNLAPPGAVRALPEVVPVPEPPPLVPPSPRARPAEAYEVYESPVMLAGSATASPPSEPPVTIRVSPLPQPEKEKGFLAEMCSEVVDFACDWFGSVRFAHKEKDEVKNLSKKDMFKSSAAQCKVNVAVKKANEKNGKAGGKGNGQGNGKSGGKAQVAVQDGALDKVGDWAEDAAEDVADALGAIGDMALGIQDALRIAPVFVTAQALVAFVGWAYTAIRDGTENGGLESIYPGWTDLALTQDCEDYRPQVYRWLSYQFSHANFTHVFTNCFLLVLLGIPLEGYHGHVRLFLMFNVGVAGGALCFLVNDPHSRVVGMSGGCYALLGMHLGDIALNYKERRFANAKLVMIFLLATNDVALSFLHTSSNTSHSAHLGGWVAGLIICTLFGANPVVNKYERHFQTLALLIGLALVLFCLIWGLRWAPQDIWEQVRWCWARQISSVDIFGDTDWHCVRCDSLACAAKWSAESNIASVAVSECEEHGWAISER